MKQSAVSLLVSGLALAAFAGALNAQDATRGSALYDSQCATCHGDHLQGRSAPPLARPDIASRYPGDSLAAKIHNTMPPDKQGTLSAPQAADLAAWIRQANPASPASAAGTKSDFPPTANLNQLMRGVMFPNSNIIFTVQTHDPAEKKKAGNDDTGFNWSQWGNDLYTGWDIVDYAALALAESAPLMLTPGRSCQNGKPVPVNDPEWIRFTKEMAEVGRAAYRASQTRNQEKVSDVSGDVADACLNCHSMYRDRTLRGKGPGDPSSAELRCSKK
ncbi:MAG TPA: cytochrome c [Bryobacteraceae bacterium]|jgi:cytochrome c553|nr:cytochrome c [Bryobacteraceae bacterium]